MIRYAVRHPNAASSAAPQDENSEIVSRNAAAKPRYLMDMKSVGLSIEKRMVRLAKIISFLLQIL